MNLVLIVTAVLAAVVLVTVGVFSILSLFWGDLLESDPSERNFSKAA